MTAEVSKWLEACSRILEFPWDDQRWEEENSDQEGDEGSEGTWEEEALLADPTLGKDNAEDCVRIGAKDGEGSVTLRYISKLEIDLQRIPNVLTIKPKSSSSFIYMFGDS